MASSTDSAPALVGHTEVGAATADGPHLEAQAPVVAKGIRRLFLPVAVLGGLRRVQLRQGKGEGLTKAAAGGGMGIGEGNDRGGAGMGGGGKEDPGGPPHLGARLCSTVRVLTLPLTSICAPSPRRNSRTT